MDEDMSSLLKNNTWQLVSKPEDKKVVGCRWIFKRNDGIPGVEKKRLKARVVHKNLELKQMDLKTTLLHSDLEETIYMQQLEGYTDMGDEGNVCLLQKYLYGLKQSPRQ